MKKKNFQEPTLHIGQLLKSYIDRNKIFKSVLARKLNSRDAQIIRYQKSASLKTEVLLALCHALKHNFFTDIAALLPSDYSTDVPKDTTYQEQIAQLKEQVKTLESERNILKQVLIGRGE